MRAIRRAEIWLAAMIVRSSLPSGSTMCFKDSAALALMRSTSAIFLQYRLLTPSSEPDNSKNHQKRYDNNRSYDGVILNIDHCLPPIVREDIAKVEQN